MPTMPAIGETSGRARDAEPQLAALHQVGVASCRARSRTRPMLRQAADRGALGDGLVGDADLGEHAGDDQRGDHRGDDTDGQRDTEALDRAGARGRTAAPAASRVVTLESMIALHALLKPICERALQPGARVRGVLLPGSLEDQHVGVDRHADGEHEAGQAGQGQRGAEAEQHRVGEQGVRRQRERGERSRRGGRR